MIEANTWSSSLAWTLLHSLWQSGIIVLFIIAISRLFKHNSKARYLIGIAGLLSIVISSIITFAALSRNLNPNGVAGLTSSLNFEVANSIEIIHEKGDLTQAITTSIEKNFDIILLVWFCGMAVFLIKFFISCVQLNRLKKNLNILDLGMQKRVARIATKIRLHTKVVIAESALVTMPIVFGILKPMIVLPAGIVTGLPTEQLETILLHELAHIKRFDYVVNILQSIVEIVFFFNPFVWKLSSMVRTEREYCCDDLVVLSYGSAIAYAKALVSVEEFRMDSYKLALSLGRGKNQLLTRIKRIMEKPLPSRFTSTRIVPVTLMIIGLICASWLTINGDEMDHENATDQDTTSRKKQTTIQAPDPITPVPHDEFVPDVNIDVPHIAPIPSVDVIPSIPPIPTIDLQLSSNFLNDTIPNRFNSEKWTEFEKAFEKSFQEKFGSFYEENQEQFQALMKDMEDNFNNRFSEEEGLLIAAHAREMAEHAEKISGENIEIMLHQQEAMLEANAVNMKLQEEHMKELAVDMERLAEENQEHMRAIEMDLKETERKMKLFHEILQTELIHDGYLVEGDEINQIQSTDDGDFIVNGKAVKPEHRKKYHEMHKKLMQH